MATTPVPPDALELLRACVDARNACWLALAQLEHCLAPDGISERANDRLVDLIDELAAGADFVQPPITEAHLLRAVEIATFNPRRTS